MADEGKLQRRIYIPLKTHSEITYENSLANESRPKDKKLNSSDECVRLIEDGIKYRKEKRKKKL